MSKQQLMFHPIISSIQKIALYETKTRFYLIGSNNTQTRIRVLKIDRTEPRELIMEDDKIEYNKQQIHELINMIDTDNRSNRYSGFTKVVSAFGIVGFVRFLEGYYIVLVTKRTRVAVIGCHSIYKIEESSMTYIPSDTSKLLHPDEQRYVRMFQAIDLSTNFYYSYSYDLTHSLQINMAPPRRLAPLSLGSMCRKAEHLQRISEEPKSEDCTCKIEESEILHDDEDLFETLKQRLNNSRENQPMEFGVRPVPQWKFVWNSHLLSPVYADLHPDWYIYVIHGFVDQSNMSIFGRSIYITLIARRSNQYAGTRFLKRGANCHGDVANEVETEQIVHDSMLSSLKYGRFSSFVQMRGSIPGNWSQDISKMVPKPAISVDLSDPFAEIPAKHFNNMFRQYGAPIILLNLVKKREKKRHESLLTEEISSAVKYLNQFLPPEHAIQYCHLDMARMNKSTESRVLDRLAEFARTVVRKTGIFLSGQSYGELLGVPGHQGGQIQTGIVRVNCVDCLDRTNTAQFAIGKCVLGYQLCALGFLEIPQLHFDSDCIRLLECLYEDHGDTLALQYGGSQLVHRIKTYRKTAPWSSHGNDIMQTLSRYYSNTFSDAEKQNTINLFLGLFVPEPTKPALWESSGDYYLHHPEAVRFTPNRNSLTKWWNDSAIRHLPMSEREMRKLCCEMIGLQRANDGMVNLEMVNAYQDYLRPHEYSVMSECHGIQMFNSLRDLVSPYTQNPSPFKVHGRAEGAVKGRPVSKNPTMMGRSSTGSNNSSDSNPDSSSEDELSSIPSTRQVSPLPMKTVSLPYNFKDNFRQVSRERRIVIKEPSKLDMNMYKKYVNFDRKSNKVKNIMGTVNLTVSSAFSIDSSTIVIPPTVTKTDREIYRQHVVKSNGPSEPSKMSKRIYEIYVNFNK